MRFPPTTCHGIQRTGPCRVSGQHLSEAPNAPAFSEKELLAGDKDRAEFSTARADHRAHADEVHRLRCMGAL